MPSQTAGLLSCIHRALVERESSPRSLVRCSPLCSSLSGADGRGCLSLAGARVEVCSEGRLRRKLISLATLAARHLLGY